MDKELLEKELYPFLNLTTKEELKTIALENVVGLTGSEEGLSYIRDSDLLLTAIVTLTEDKRPDIQEQSFTALINLTTNEATCQRILQLKNCENKVSDWLALVIDANYKFADLVCKLLSNLTRSEQCAKLASNVVLQNEKVNIEKIVLVLCNVAYNKNANLHYLAAILSNLSQVREIRTRIMDKEQCTIQRLLPFTEFKQSSVRRAGVIGTLKNCCFDTEYHDWLLSDDVELLPRLLLPLAGPEEFDDDDMEKLPDMLQYLPEDKQRETEPHIRKMITEAILQLCATKKGRHYVKEKNTYVIMREYYAWERKQDLFNEISAMNLIDVLISDEPGEDFGENLKEVEIPEDLTEKFINDDSKELKLAETEMAELSKETSK